MVGQNNLWLDTARPSAFNMENSGTTRVDTVETLGSIEMCHHFLVGSSISGDLASSVRHEYCQLSSVSTHLRCKKCFRCIRHLKVYTHAASVYLSSCLSRPRISPEAPQEIRCSIRFTHPFFLLHNLLDGSKRHLQSDVRHSELMT